MASSSTTSWCRSEPARRLAAALLALGLLSSVGAAAEGGPEGTWIGSYTCRQGLTGLTLTIERSRQRALVAYFHFYPPDGAVAGPAGCFRLAGTWDAAARALDLRATNWIEAPEGFAMVDLSGMLETGGAAISGLVTGPDCTSFAVRRAPPQPLSARCGGAR